MPNNICCIDADKSGEFDVSESVVIRRISNGEIQSLGKCSSVSLNCGNNITEQGEQCDYGINNGKKCDNNRRDCEYCSVSCKIIERQENDNNNNNGRNTGFQTLSFNSLCEPHWQCGNWGECADGVMKRNCKDVNSCETPYDKPQESLGCEVNLAKKAVLQNDKIPSVFLFLLALFIVILILLIFNLKNIKTVQTLK